MITKEDIDTSLRVFRNSQYTKEKGELTLKFKKILQDSDEFPILVEEILQRTRGIRDATQRGFLAGLMIGIQAQLVRAIIDNAGIEKEERKNNGAI